MIWRVVSWATIPYGWALSLDGRAERRRLARVRTVLDRVKEQADWN